MSSYRFCFAIEDCEPNRRPDPTLVWEYLHKSQPFRQFSTLVVSHLIQDLDLEHDATHNKAVLRQHYYP